MAAIFGRGPQQRVQAGQLKHRGHQPASIDHIKPAVSSQRRMMGGDQRMHAGGVEETDARHIDEHRPRLVHRIQQHGGQLIPHGEVTVTGQDHSDPARAANHPRVGVTWNSNATDVVNGSVAEYFRLLRPWIKSCHINELHSGYPYRELFRLLRESGYDRVTLAEIAGMPDVASGERLMRYYKALWTELARP